MKIRRLRTATTATVLVAVTVVGLYGSTLLPRSSGASGVVVHKPLIIKRAKVLAVPHVFTSPKLSIHAAPATLPVVLSIPAIGVNAPLLSVGLTSSNAMDAPEGGATSPYWRDAFWFRGGSAPGAVGTATIAGHIDNAFGSYAVFGHLSDLRRGDQILIRVAAKGLVEHFVVTGTHAYTLPQTRTLPVLDRIYGSGPPHGLGPLPAPDGRAHLSLVTCAGTWESSLGTHNERLVVSAVRVS